MKNTQEVTYSGVVFEVKGTLHKEDYSVGFQAYFEATSIKVTDSDFELIDLLMEDVVLKIEELVYERLRY